MSADGKPPLSPAWKRPTDLMKIRCKRRNSSSSERVPLRPFNTLKSPTRSPQSASPARKRRNPFTCSPNRKRLNLGAESEEVGADSDFLLFQMLDKVDGAFSPPTHKNSPSSNDDKVFDELDGAQSSEIAEPDEPAKELGKRLMPLDWSLKTKVRFVSSEPFSWSGPLKTQDEANGVSLYVRKSAQLPSTEFGEQSELKSATMYWMHPNIPWLTLFPRHVQDSRIGKPSVVTLDEHMFAQLHRDWTQSFASLYNLLKANVCPYFYVLCYPFSVLFRAASICGEQNALLTPTTRGFREAVTNEGITFTMPLAGLDDSESVSTASSANSLEDDIQSTDTGASLFLESIGVDKRKFPELNPEKVKMEREDYKRIDSRPESLIQVEGEETKQLFNYLLNCRSCIANTGVQRGMPPTLLAPVAFNGATLKSLQMKQGSVRQSGPGNVPVKMYTLEIGGAILPDCLARLADLMARTQGSFSASASTHEPTSTFNDVRKTDCKSYHQQQPSANDGGANDGGENDGGANDGTFLSEERVLIESAIRSLQFRNGRYYYSST